VETTSVTTVASRVADRQFEDFVRREFPSIRRTAFLIVGDSSLAEDLTQEGFAKAFVRWSRVSTLDRPGAWVRRVVIRDAVRLAQRRRRVEPSMPTVCEPESNDALAEAITQLPTRQRAAVVLKYWDGLTSAEIADALGCRTATVDVHLHRARQQLKLQLTNEVPHGTR
jgi:RNA polymerase sigma-70 factor (sigma-E family)